MWLSAISKRTPQAYFLYFLTGLCIAAFSVFGSFQAAGEFTPVQSSKWIFLLPAIIVLILSSLTNRVVVLADVFSKNTLWPGQIYLLLTVLIGMSLNFMDVAIHGLVGVWIMHELLITHYNQDARKRCFNTGLCIGLASLFDSTVIFMAPFILFGLRTLKPLNYKEYALFLLGLSAPFYFIFGYSFLSGDSGFWDGLFPVDTWFVIPSQIAITTWLRWALLALAIVGAGVSIFMRYNSMPVRMRRLTLTVFYVLGGCALMSMAGGINSVMIFYAAPALAFLLTLLMLRYSNMVALEWIHLIFVIVIIGALLTTNL